jgi:hypothetical protein
MLPAQSLVALLIVIPPVADAPGSPVEIAMYAGDGVTGRGPMMLEKTFAAAADFRLRKLTAAGVRGGKLAEVRAFIVPGGIPRQEAGELLPEGRDAIKRFVAGGGCYVGICAGCYLATSEYEWSLGILPAKVIDRANWERGRATLRLELTAVGRDWFRRTDDRIDCLYHNGPVLRPDSEAKGKLIPLAYFREEIVRRGAKDGLMTDTPAAVAARYEKGWAVGISPHPEQTEGLKDFIPSAIRWALTHPR